jgi:adenine-specific DNA-methyltransferase
MFPLRKLTVNMPTLHWVGKERVINHHHDVPFRVLKHQSRYRAPESLSANTTDNFIVHGDNLEALKSLLPQFEGRVDCIYIDPPYNTGNESWAYNDNVNDPKIKKWLGQVVGREGEDLSRHDKWLCMMYPRLTLLRRLLAKDGAIFISIDDWEIHNLRSIMDEIFGAGNFIGQITWEKGKKGDAKFLSETHEYVLIYVRDKPSLIEAKTKWRVAKRGAQEVLEHYESLKQNLHGDHQQIRRAMMAWYRSMSADDSRKAHKHYNWSDARGLYFAADFAGPDDGRDSRPRYNITHPVTGKPCAKPSTGWRWDEETTRKALAEDPPRIHFGPDETTIPNRKSYLFEVDSEPLPSVIYKDGRAGTLEVEKILGKGVFQFPKDTDVLAILLGLQGKKDALILDSFAGSGSTAHAVLKLNAQDGGTRRFIMVEMMDYADTITAERTRCVMAGYSAGKRQIAGLGGGFDFYTVGDPLFLDEDVLNEAVGVELIRDYAAYAEGIVLEDRTTGNSPYTPYLLGLNADTAWVFHYEPDIVTSLDMDFLSTLKFGNKKPKTAIIYADKCLLSKDFMAKHGIIFKKVPRDITRF